MKEEDVRFSLPGELARAASRLDDNIHSMSPAVPASQTAWFERFAAAVRARRRESSVAAGPARLLVGRADRRHHARIRLHSAAAVDASAARTASGIRPRRALIDKAAQSILARQLPDGGFNIYPQGPVGDQRDREGVLRAEAGRPAVRRSAPGARARAHSGAGRHAGGQQLRQDQSQPVRSVSARALPVDSAGDDAAAGNFIYQMSSWTRAIVISLSIVHAQNPQRPVPAGFTLEELFLPGVASGVSGEREGYLPGATLFLRIDRALKLWERHGSAAAFARRPSARAEQLDARALRRFRRPGRDLSAHDVRHHGARCAGLSPKIIPLRQEAVRQFEALMVDDGDRLLLPALLLAGLGHGHRGVRAGRIRTRLPRDALRARPIGCCRRKSGARATGR